MGSNELGDYAYSLWHPIILQPFPFPSAENASMCAVDLIDKKAFYLVFALWEATLRLSTIVEAFAIDDVMALHLVAPPPLLFLLLSIQLLSNRFEYGSRT